MTSQLIYYRTTDFVEIFDDVNFCEKQILIRLKMLNFLHKTDLNKNQINVTS